MTINEMISAYNQAKEKEKQAKKAADQLKTMILNYANGRDFFETDNYNVMINRRVSVRIDTDLLYKDFPDFKNVYGKTSVSEIITAKEKQQEKKTA